MTGRESLSSTDEPRGWVKRLGAYLRIFGPPASGTSGYRTSGHDGPPGSGETYLDQLARMAQEHEAKFGEKR